MKTDTIQITPELLALLSEIDEFKGAWCALGTIAPEKLRALRHTQGTIRSDSPDLQLWLIFFMRALQQQKRRLAVKVEREKNALAALPELIVKILDYARDHGRVTPRDMVRDMVREHGTSPNTLKRTFTSLVEKGPLVCHGGGRSTWYSLS